MATRVVFSFQNLSLSHTNMSGDFAVVPSNTTSAPSPFLGGPLQPSGAAPYFGDGSLYGGLLHKPFDGKGASRPGFLP